VELQTRKVALVAYDNAPSGALMALKAGLSSAGYETISFFGKDGTIQKNQIGIILGAMSEARYLVVGISSQEALAQAEMAAVEHARKCSVRVVWFCDAPLCYMRPWALSRIGDADIVYVTSEYDAAFARQQLPAVTMIEVVGSPEWEQNGIFPADKFKSSAAIRSALGVKESDALCVVAGSKTESCTFEIIYAIADAKKLDPTIRYVFFRHPGDGRNHEYYLPILNPAHIELPPAGMTSSQAVWGANYVATGYSPGTDMTAMFALVPLINVIGPEAEKKVILESGEPVPLLCNQGAAVLTSNNGEEIVSAMRQLQNAIPELTNLQESLYPRPTRKGESVEKMLKILEDPSAYR
jgi:hypothetical protein